jgi:hypothetical protein
MKKQITLLIIFLMCFLLTNCTSSTPLGEIVVNSLEDLADPPAGTVTLRSALATAASGQTISFDASLNGGTIELSIVGEEHSILKGEVMGMRIEPSGPVSYLVGYFDRDYGKSALYARKNVVIDASDLPDGITLAWTGGAPARVLAVYGNLTMNNITITGGRSVAEDISTGNPDDQPWTLARGGAVAVWGIARLTDCKLYNNYCEGDFDPSRDRGAFGGGLYANIVEMENCIVSGNSILGAGAAGGGVFSVGGADTYRSASYIEQSSVTGNRISGYFAYGGGVYSDGGGIGNAKTLYITNSTIAENLVESPGYIPFGYWRGGGVYMSNGSLVIRSCTIVQNQTYGVPRTDDLGKPNLAGGIAATIGNAHAVEDMIIGHSVIAGNTVHETGGTVYDQDIFTGSVFYFDSLGHNRIGVVDFSQILVPVGVSGWLSLCRKHYPKQGDVDGVDIAAVLNLDSGITRSNTILSAGVNASDPVALYYEPQGSALDQIPAQSYWINEIYADYEIAANGTNDFLAIVLSRLEAQYNLTDFSSDFTADFETFLGSIDTDDVAPGNQPYTDPLGNPILTLADTQWFGPAETWPKELPNYPYIEFWHRLDNALLAENIPGMGPELMGDEVWATLFSSGPLAENNDITMTLFSVDQFEALLQDIDQLGNLRPANVFGDIGAVEVQ